MNETGYATERATTIARPQPEAPCISSHLSSANERLADMNKLASEICARLNCETPDSVAQPVTAGIPGQVQDVHQWLGAIHSKLVQISNAL